MKSLQDVESGYDFSEVTYDGLSVWMLLRSFIHLKMVERNSNGYSMSFRTRSVLKLIKNGMTGILNLFRLKRFDYWFFANSDKRNLIDGKYKENYFDDIADKLGQDKSLFVEYTIDVFKPRNQIYSKYVISDLIFKLLSSLLSRFVKIEEVKNLALIEGVVHDEQLSIDLKNTLKFYIAEYNVYKFIFKYFKPKAVFLICYYSKIPMLVAAHDCGVKVIEYQHGVITNESGEYNSILKNNKRYFPDFLLSFGRKLITCDYKDFIYEKENIIPLGSSYMESIRRDYVDEYLDQLKKKYSKIICVTSSGIFLDKLMKFVQNLSFKNPNMLFVVRKKHRENVELYLSDNIVLLPKYTIYQILKYSDFNITIASFVAYEADFYCVRNILLNIDGLSVKYIDSDVEGVYVEEKDMMNFNIAENKNSIQPSENYFVRFADKIDSVCAFLENETCFY